ncbi:CCA tRNA nucleotidyltransferase [Aurantiacibacter marinus]|uniref:Polynucleotide adenylyltransferase n=1 Tax=Aurantiacibacter marinus TaxID=874156 RepID=A0A0H0XMI8_9SPHN|nr:CCA tRNA nucleotidyltransferase [Aurantiacibacter marinus]KLI63236.1 polynucleotide adenylyltransferase [Aurantiacibacter marinus]
MAKLPHAEWTRRKDLVPLVAALGPENMRWVGGAVRDTLLDVPVNDVDAATVLHPETVMAKLGEAGIKSIPTGIDHGTVTAVVAGGNVEITTLRKDVATDGRRATVAFAENWRDDAARRDFTINALYAHPETLEISDYFSGLEDLEARRVRFIGDAHDRIREDHLRILRYYRFQARFGAALDPAAETACAELASTLKGISRERVAMEMLAILALPDPHPTLARMQDHGVLPVVLPEAGIAGLKRLAALVEMERGQETPPSAIRRLAALVPPDRKTAEQIAARLRLSNAQRKLLSRLAQRSDLPEGPRALAYREGADIARDLLLLAGLPIDTIQGWQVPDFPLKGGQIVARGIGAGPEVARILQAVEARWISEGFPPASRVAELLEECLSQ